MRKSAISALASVCMLMLVFNAAGSVHASVEVDYEDSGSGVDWSYADKEMPDGSTAMDLLNATCNSVAFDWLEWGAFVYGINGHEANWELDSTWYKFTYQHSGGQPIESDVFLSNYVLQDGDTIGMWWQPVE